MLYSFTAAVQSLQFSRAEYLRPQNLQECDKSTGELEKLTASQPESPHINTVGLNTEEIHLVNYYKYACNSVLACSV